MTGTCPECERVLPVRPCCYHLVVVHTRADGSECVYGSRTLPHQSMAQQTLLSTDEMWDLPETPLDRVLASFSGTLAAMGVQPGDYLK